MFEEVCLAPESVVREVEGGYSLSRDEASPVHQAHERNRDFGFSEYCTPMWSLEQDLERFPEAGATCLELCEAKLDFDRLEMQLGLVKQSGLRVSCVQPAVESFFEVKLSATLGNLEANRESLYHSVERVGRNRIGDRINTISGVIPGQTWAEALPTFAREYRELCLRAAHYGIRIMVEPLHPIYCGLDSMISSFQEVLQLIERVGAPNLGITCDLWHIWQRENIDAEIETCAPLIWTVHISDWRAPRCAVDRHIPGEGMIPLSRLLSTLERAGYRNGYLVEFFSDLLLPDSLWRQDMREVLRRCKQGFERAWAF
jgi:sugar phosphate isomerase/epimerase